MAYFWEYCWINFKHWDWYNYISTIYIGTVYTAWMPVPCCALWIALFKILTSMESIVNCKRILIFSPFKADIWKNGKIFEIYLYKYIFGTIVIFVSCALQPKANEEWKLEIETMKKFFNKSHWCVFGIKMISQLKKHCLNQHPISFVCFPSHSLWI